METRVSKGTSATGKGEQATAVCQPVMQRGFVLVALQLRVKQASSFISSYTFAALARCMATMMRVVVWYDSH